MRQALRGGQAARRALAQPFAHDCAVDLDAAEKVAPQAFVGNMAHGVEQQRVGLLQRGPGFFVVAVGPQRAAVPPPDVLAASTVGARQALRHVQSRDLRACAQRCCGVAVGELRLGQRYEDVALVPGAGLAVEALRGEHLSHCRCGVAFSLGARATQQQTRNLHAGVAQAVDQGIELAPLGVDVELAQDHLLPQLRTELHAQGKLQPGLAAQHHVLVVEPNGVVIQAELDHRDAEVADGHGAAIDVASAVEGRHRLLQQRHALGDVLAREGQHDERVADALFVATLARQRQRAPRRRL